MGARADWRDHTRDIDYHPLPHKLYLFPVSRLNQPEKYNVLKKEAGYVNIRTPYEDHKERWKNEGIFSKKE